MTLDRYTVKAFFKITAPLWIMGLFLLLAIYAPWIVFVVFACIVVGSLLLIGNLVKDEASQMRSDVYNHRN